tara:strand:+ start:320 stop:1342 length:1023 start_codon:yes stop_codon:yes gene_type:complete
MCPEKIKPEFVSASLDYKSHLNAAKNAKIDLSKIMPHEFMPPKVVNRFYGLSCCVLEHIFTQMPEPSNYSTLDSLNKIVRNIRDNPIRVDYSFLKDYSPRNHLDTAFVKKLLYENDIKIKYDMFGTITGRMTTDKSGLSIMTMPKELRPAILPKNDFLLEIDYNAAELRVALSLLGYSQPKEDIHEWNMQNVFSGTTNRNDAKKKIFAWLYNSSSENSEIEKTYDRKSILNKYYTGGVVKNIFGREIPCEPKVALNYIIQSTAADMFSRQLIKVSGIIKNKKTKILYTMHDSIVLDFSQEDSKLIPEIVSCFSNTDLGDFVVNISAGEKYNQMKVKKWTK